MKVELKYSSAPGVLGRIALHYWFVVYDGLKFYRLEVWHCPDRNDLAAGHIRKRARRLHQSVGGGPSWIGYSWTGETAERIAAALEESYSQYPYRDRYRYWPGPNSNTYVAWVLRRAGVTHRLSWRAFGKRFT